MTSPDSRQLHPSENESLDFDAQNIDKLIKTVSFPQNTLKDACISFEPLVHARVHSSLAWSFKRGPKSTLGYFENLPREIRREIFIQLDIQSIFLLRQVNRSARQAVGAMKEYQRVATHGLDMYCALLRTRAALTVTLSDFYYALCTPSCSQCGEYAGFVSLILWSRLCFYCLTTAPAAETVSHSSLLIDLAKEERGELSDISPLKILPGSYTMKQMSPVAGTLMVSAADASRVDARNRYNNAGFDNTNSNHPLIAWFTVEENNELSRKIAVLQMKQRMDRYHRLRVRFAAQHANTDGPLTSIPPLHTRSSAPDPERDYLLRFVACCSLAHYNRDSGQVELPITCAGCLFLDPEFDSSLLPNEKPTLIYKQYTQEGFLEHFKLCGQAQLLWELSKQGTVTPVYPSGGILYK